MGPLSNADWLLMLIIWLLAGLGYQQQQHAFPYNLVSDNDIFLSLLGPYHQPGPSLADDFLTTGVDPVYSDELNHTSFALASRDRPAAPDRPPAPSLDFDFASHHHNNLHTPLHPFSYRPPDLVATTHIPTAFDNPHWAPLPPSIPRTALQNEVEPTGQAERRLRDELLLLGSATQVPTNGAILFPPPNMPAAASRKRSRAASCIDDRTGPSAGSNKRKTNTVGHRPTNAARAPSTVVNLAEWSDSDDLFGPDAQVYDLTNDDVQPGELVVHNNPKKEEEEDNRVRLAKFECIICMDNASNLTVTHCGMLSTHASFPGP